MAGKLTGADREACLAELAGTGWAETPDRDAISKTFQFADFAKAFAWMTEVARCAEEANHHPEWTNVYRTVSVVLTTHDAGGLTEKDAALAREMDRLAR